MATRTVSKTVFKARALELFREVQASGEPLLITDQGRPVLKLSPYYGEADAVLASLRGSVLEYRDPTGPAGEGDWEVFG